MPQFNMGYPKRTGNAEEDLAQMYNFLCELSDRLTYQFNYTDNALDAIAGQKQTGSE